MKAQVENQESGAAADQDASAPRFRASLSLAKQTQTLGAGLGGDQDSLVGVTEGAAQRQGWPQRPSGGNVPPQRQT